jgi:sorbitol-specific phosphotransferase system component IIC
MVKGERKEAWFRIIVAIVTGIILSAWGHLVCLLAFINWLIVVFSGKRSKGIAEFCEYWNTESYKFMKYLTFVTNKRPFPFSSMERMSKFS